MSKKRPSDEQLRSALNLGVTTPMQQEARLAPSDPLISMPMKVDIRQIELYDRNPRRSQNSAYEDIKESVRAQGLKQPLVITRRPGAERYMLKHGGNTRLTVLKELHAETGDRRFQQADCVFEPWQGETDVLVSHIVENEVRGSLTFIDKARAVREAAAMLEADSGDKLSLRQLSDALRERGFRISAGMISKCFYALDTLLQAIPTALDSGIGKPQIEKLRQLQTGAKQVWDNHRLGSAEMFEAVFVEALAQADGENWNHENAWRCVEVALAQRAGEPMNRIAAELDAVLVGSVGADEEPWVMSSIPAPIQDLLEDFGPRTEDQRPTTASRGTDGRTVAPAELPKKVAHRSAPRGASFRSGRTNATRSPLGSATAPCSPPRRSAAPKPNCATATACGHWRTARDSGAKTTAGCCLPAHAGAGCDDPRLAGSPDRSAHWRQRAQ